GGTESDNLAVKGVMRGVLGDALAPGDLPGVVVSEIEHRAMIAPAARLAGEGARVAFAPVTSEGIIDLDRLSALLNEQTAFVSVMAVNNEIGTRQPLSEVLSLVRERSPRAVLHTDAVQAPMWIDPKEFMLCDLVTVTGHKVGGPRGIGALVVREGVKLVAEIEGGGQERGLRAGTPDVAAAVALALALEVTVARRDETATRVRALRDRLVSGVLASVPDVVLVGAANARVDGFAPFALAGIESESLLVLLDRAGVDAAAGSSCASGATEPSHVLTALGVDPKFIGGALRCSLGWSTTADEVDHMIKVLPEAVNRLRALRVEKPAAAVTR
ncbi:MAG: aminotransferase class V-fold PLP-dependent enzyme, partial [Acidimicrobiia bacterium]|nr:aminotransferase class V-fold PLP-dependent enzyme [Acidimicrobiia bacterium]